MTNKFYDDGYDFLLNFLPEKALAEFENSLTNLFLDNCPGTKNVFEASVKLDLENKDLLYKIYLNIPKAEFFSKMRAYCYEHFKTIYPDHNYMDVGSGVLFGLPRDKRLTWAWHQEGTYHPGIEKIVHYWLPLYNNSTINNGAMAALVKSHKLGTLDFTVHKPFSNGGTSLIPENIVEHVKNHDEVVFEIKRGDVAFFDKNLIHKSNYNHSDFTRFTCVFRLVAYSTLPPETDFNEVIKSKNE